MRQWDNPMRRREQRKEAARQAAYGNYWAGKFVDLCDSYLELRQAAWDAYTEMGFDTDGDSTPDAIMDLAGLIRRAGVEMREDYDAALEEIPPVGGA